MSSTLVSLTAVTPHLFAYLDPGTGSMAFQVMLAGVLSGMVFCRSAVQVIRQRLGFGTK